MSYTTKYYQGDSIGFYIQGDNEIDLVSTPFKILFYSTSSNQIHIDKEDMTQVGTENKYSGTIANTKTKNLPTGVYTQEILLGDDFTSISKNEAFILVSSLIKQEISTGSETSTE